MLREPRTTMPLDVEASIRQLPADAAVKGIFFSNVVRQARPWIGEAELVRAAGVAPQRWLAFVDYPYADWMRVAAAAARTLAPGETEAAGMRKLGGHAYDAVLDTHVGRVVFGVLGIDIGAVLRNGPRGYAMLLNFGKTSAEVIGPGRVLYQFRQFPAFLETYQVGVLEGALRHCRARGRVLIDLLDLANADVEVSYDPKSVPVAASA